MSMLSKDRGWISLKTLFILLLLFIIIHVAVKLVPLYIDAERLKDEMSVKASLAQTLKDDDILADLATKAKDLGLPLKRDDFKLLRNDEAHRMAISTKWDVTVHFFLDVFPPYTTRVFHFEPVIEEDYSRRF